MYYEQKFKTFHSRQFGIICRLTVFISGLDELNLHASTILNTVTVNFNFRSLCTLQIMMPKRESYQAVFAVISFLKMSPPESNHTLNFICGRFLIVLLEYVLFSQRIVLDLMDLVYFPCFRTLKPASYFSVATVFSLLPIENRVPSQYKDRLIYVWRFPC